jgi:mannose-6-phosphate isomerase-like protein (cupin superfamily)
MAGYTALQLNEVEDQSPNLGLPPEFELRMARVPLNCEKCGISYQRFAPGWRQPVGHNHKQQEEVFILASGSARMKLDDDVIELKPWTAVRVAPKTMRSIEGGPEGAEIIAIGAPNTGPGDGNNVPGWWSD